MNPNDSIQEQDEANLDDPTKVSGEANNVSETQPTTEQVVGGSTTYNCR